MIVHYCYRHYAPAVNNGVPQEEVILSMRHHLGKKTVIIMLSTMFLVSCGDNGGDDNVQSSSTSRSVTAEPTSVSVEDQQEIIDAAVDHMEEYRNYIVSATLIQKIDDLTTESQGVLEKDYTSAEKFKSQSPTEQEEILRVFEGVFVLSQNFAGYDGLSPLEKLALGTALTKPLTVLRLQYDSGSPRQEVRINKDLVFFDPSDSTVVFPGTSIVTKVTSKNSVPDSQQSTIILEADGLWRIDPTPFINAGLDMLTGTGQATSEKPFGLGE